MEVKTKLFSLGIDVGGSYADIALLDNHDTPVWCSKLPTYGKRTSAVFEEALSEVFENAPLPEGAEGLSRVSLCTTLVTNALVEKRFRPTVLFLLGYPAECIDTIARETREIRDLKIFPVAGGHNRSGDERSPLDERGVLERVSALENHAQAVAISGFYSVRNPSHEIRARELIEQALDIPVACGYQLSSNLNSVKRATTVALNASLIPIANTLIRELSATLSSFGVTCPFFIVRSDGTLMSEGEARDQPIKMLMSGPAASIKGAAHLFALKGQKNESYVIVDMGGTTSDIAVVRDGSLETSDCETTVGGFRTIITSLKIRTYGLGGDSHVCFDEKEPFLKNEKVVPLALLATYSGLGLDSVSNLLANEENEPVFLIHPPHTGDSNDAPDLIISTVQRERVVPVNALPTTCSEETTFLRENLERHLRLGKIEKSSLTPTDALNMLDRCHIGDVQISALGINRFAKLLQTEETLPLDGPDLASKIVMLVSKKLSRCILETLIETSAFYKDLEAVNQQTVSSGHFNLEPLYDTLVKEDLVGNWKLTISIEIPLIGVGAPIAEFLPETARSLNTRSITFEHGSVAGAIGAASTHRDIKFSVWIHCVSDKGVFRAHLPTGPRDTKNLCDAIEDTKDFMTDYVLRSLKKDPSEIHLVVEENWDTTTLPNGETFFFGLWLTFSLLR